jgi:hypothetical protein
MKTTIRTVAASIYGLLAGVAAVFIWNADDSVGVGAGFFAWDIACAALFAYAVSRATGRSPGFVLPVVFCGPLLQVVIVSMFVQHALGDSYGSALRGAPAMLADVMATQPVLYSAWLGLPVLVAYMVLHFNAFRSGRHHDAA